MYRTKLVNSYGNASVFGEKAKTATATGPVARPVWVFLFDVFSDFLVVA
jgi:hypothetical protein